MCSKIDIKLRFSADGSWHQSIVSVPGKRYTAGFTHGTYLLREGVLILNTSRRRYWKCSQEGQRERIVENFQPPNAGMRSESGLEFVDRDHVLMGPHKGGFGKALEFKETFVRFDPAVR